MHAWLLHALHNPVVAWMHGPLVQVVGAQLVRMICNSVDNVCRCICMAACMLTLLYVHNINAAHLLAVCCCSTCLAAAVSLL